MTSDFYRSGAGREICVKRPNGTEHNEAYNFSNTGSFIRLYGNKTFVVACPSSQEWKSILKKHIDFAAAVGADTVFFDQMGLAGVPCSDPAHGHKIPFTDTMDVKRNLLLELREHARKLGLGFMSECITDQISCCVDAMHLVGSVAEVWNPGWRERGEVPRFMSDRNLYRQAFPETIISNRNLRDGREVKFQVNRMFVLGLRTDCEIYRCRATIATIPEYQDYLGKVNALRERFGDILYEGKYIGPKGHSFSDPRIQSSAFILGENLAVAACHSFRETLSADVSVPGFKIVEYASARSDAMFDGKTLTLPQDSLTVLFFRREK